MSKSLCKGKRTSQPNLCKKVRGCKVANGTIHNKNNKTKKTRKTPSKKTLIKRKLSRALKILK